MKPIDEELLCRAAGETGALVTVEEHSVVGGVGGAVAELLATRCPTPLERVGLQDRYAESGPYDSMLDRYGMAVEDIVAAAERAVSRK